jgi:mono/diheme cytochrome c family protein
MSGLIKGAAVLATSLWLVNSAAPAAEAQDAQQLYQKNCTACHGPSGKGDGPAGKMLKPPPADFATALKGKSDADSAKIIKEGGKALGRAATMPAFSSKLNDEQIKSLVELVKGFPAK